jgi:DNA-binding NarL/FixJ family response regulator
MGPPSPVLVIDDDVHWQAWIREQFRTDQIRQHFTLQKQVGTRDEFEKLDLKPFKLVLVDCYLREERANETPGAIGHAVVRDVISIGDPQVRVLAISNTRREDDVCRLYRAGAHAVWHKDDTDQLLMAMRDALRGEGLFRSESLRTQEAYWRRLQLDPKMNRERVHHLLQLAAAQTAYGVLPAELEVAEATVTRLIKAVYECLVKPANPNLPCKDRYGQVCTWAKGVGLDDEVGVPRWFGFSTERWLA